MPLWDGPRRIRRRARVLAGVCVVDGRALCRSGVATRRGGRARRGRRDVRGGNSSPEDESRKKPDHENDRCVRIAVSHVQGQRSRGWGSTFRGERNVSLLDSIASAAAFCSSAAADCAFLDRVHVLLGRPSESGGRHRWMRELRPLPWLDVPAPCQHPQKAESENRALHIHPMLLWWRSWRIDQYRKSISRETRSVRAHHSRPSRYGRGCSRLPSARSASQRPDRRVRPWPCRAGRSRVRA